MKLGIFLRNMGVESTRQTLVACLKTAEAAHFDSAFVVDHLAISPDQTEGSGGRYLDPLATLGFMAGVTKQIRIGVGVLVLPYRPAIVVAKQVATIQELSGGRLILGAGVGWMRSEFEILGVNPKYRGVITDETLEVLRQLFGNDVSSFCGKHINFPDFVFSPRPKLPPIWIGGQKRVAIPRVLNFGEAYFPMGKIELQEVAEIKNLLTCGAEKYQRDVPELVLGGTLPTTGGALDYLREFEAAGVDHFIVSFGRYGDHRSFAESVDKLSREVLPAFAT